MDYLIGVLGSLTASIIIYVFITWNVQFLSKRLSGSRLFGHGVEYKYKGQEKATKDILKDAKDSSFVYIFTIRGYSYFQPERDLSVLTEGEEKSIKLLISNPCDGSDISSVVKIRADEYKNSTPEKYKQELISGIDTIKIIMSKRSNIECRLHAEPPVFRMIILSNRIYVSFFAPYKSGSKLPVFRVNPTSDIYIGFKRYFELHWQKGANVNSVNC